MAITLTIAPKFRLQMDERFHECATSSSAACPSAGPTTVFATTTPGCVAKPYSTPRCDEYPTGGYILPHHKWDSIKTLEILADRNILLTSEEEILLQMRSRQYSAPPESTPTTLEEAPATTWTTLDDSMP
jgi:hypothetical protein